MSLVENRAALVGIALVGVGLIALMAWSDGRARQRRDADEAAYWNITGPPCPSLTGEAFRAARLKAPRAFDYGGSRAGTLTYGVVRFGRFAGHASCNQAPNGLHTRLICQFTSPAALRIRTARGEVFYVPGVGRPATVIVDRDVPRCVMASNFTL